MAKKETRFTSPKFLSELGAPWYGAAKAITAWYIDISEQLAQGALDLQERATSWAKDTPLAPFFTTQQALVRQFVEGSASMARRLWQIERRAESEKRAVDWYTVNSSGRRA